MAPALPVPGRALSSRQCPCCPLYLLDGILLPEFYDKMAEVMQEEKTTLKSLQNSFDDIILEQWVSMHLDYPHNGQYVRPEKGVYHRRDVGSASALVRRTFSISVL